MKRWPPVTASLNKKQSLLENVESFPAVNVATNDEELSAVGFLSTEDTAGVFCKNGIPFDTQSPIITSGIRLGTPAWNTRGFGPNEFSLIAGLISKVIKGLSENGQNNSKIEKEVQKEVIDLCSSFPIYSD